MAVLVAPDPVNVLSAPLPEQPPASITILTRLWLETRREHEAVERALDLMDTALTRDAEVLVAVKSDDGLKEVPMVVLTTSTSPKDVAFCFQADANAYHVKPARHDGEG